MKRLSVLMSCGLLMLLTSCILEEAVSVYQDSDLYENTWIHQTMKTYYYWEDQLPKKTDLSSKPKDYFHSLIYKYNVVSNPQGDRFSWMEDNYKDLIASLNGVSSNEPGFDMVLFYKAIGSKELVGQVTYVKKNTPAEAAGVLRGMLFDQVNGEVLTQTNYQTLLFKTSGQMSIGLLELDVAENQLSSGFKPAGSLSFQVLANYTEDPVYLDSVYTIQDRKVGYLVYHFFADDSGDKTNSYNIKLNTVFSRFKSAGITDLILDLRYNSGGSAQASEYLASMIVPDLKSSNLYSYYQYNALLNKEFTQEDTHRNFKDTMNGQPISNVGNQLKKRLIVLTGPHTASASEQVINGLKPYMDQIVLIGDTTYGKNVASFTLYSDKDKHISCGLQPIVAKYFNKDGQSDFTAGFVPNYRVEDVGILDVKPLGDMRENLLNQAFFVLGIINKQDTRQAKYRMYQLNRRLEALDKPVRGLQLDKIKLID